MVDEPTPTDVDAVDPYIDGLVEDDYIGLRKALTENKMRKIAGNLKYLRDSVEILENNADPELRKQFNPVLINADLSYGFILEDDHYKFQPEQQDSFLDLVNAQHNRLQTWTKTTGETYVYEKAIEPGVDVQSVFESGVTSYTLKASVGDVDDNEQSYYVDKPNGKVYIHCTDDANPNGPPELEMYVVTPTISQYVDIARTSAWVNYAEGVIQLPKQYASSEAIDLDNAKITTHTVLKPVSITISAEMCRPIHRWHPLWFLDPWHCHPLTPLKPTRIPAQVFKHGTTGALSKLHFWCGPSPNFVGKPHLFHAHLFNDVYVEIRAVDGDDCPTQIVLARQKIIGVERFFNCPGLLPVVFDHPPHLTANTKYAIVWVSPFKLEEHGIQIGGFHYDAGDAVTLIGASTWISHDCGRLWVKTSISGVKEIQVKEYSFQTYVKYGAVTYPTAAKYVYWKPLKTGPVTEVTLTVSETKPTNTAIVWEVSLDNVHWYACTIVGGTGTVSKSTLNTNGEVDAHLRTVYVRAKLTTTNTAATPSIGSCYVLATCDDSIESYLLTQPYAPRVGGMQSSRLWSYVNAPFNKLPGNDDDIDISVDIIRGDRVVETFIINEETTEFILRDYPAEPMILVEHIAANGTVTILNEVVDYVVNYTTPSGGKTLTLKAAVDDGQLRVTYLPILFKGLVASDFQNDDGEWVGIRLDYFTESFTATEDQVEFILKTLALDPIKEITVNDVVQVENSDYVVSERDPTDEYPPQTIITFSTPLEADDKVIIEYTPLFTDSNILLGYRATRTTPATQDVEIKPCYIQTRI